MMMAGVFVEGRSSSQQKSKAADAEQEFSRTAIWVMGVTKRTRVHCFVDTARLSLLKKPVHFLSTHF